MLGTDFTKNKKAQSGSVMLEVIAVLALMGVMGAMLFRQIYQRNQELHNIQMASEIRTVKEAFSAYIQAHRTELLGACNANEDSTVLTKCTKDSEAIGDAIKDYLPMGWFMNGNPDDYYTLSLWTYKLADASKKQVIHGLIAPKDTTLPSTGWNFKRAARVALLIGADGGVYGDGITSDKIAGALGTWHLDKLDDMGLEPTTYVAMTGLDIFTPEYNLPEGQVNLPLDWDLATRKLGAWNYFSAGSDKATCFDVNHHVSQETGGVMQVEQDTFKACQPLFFVDADGTGKVFVNHDLEIGSGATTNLTLTQEGVMKQKNGLTIDADGRIISKDELATAIGDLKKKERYLLDPAHTSVMNDIYLTSRGGVRLSDILPNYILKGVSQLVPSSYDKTNKRYEVTKPTCPTGYKKAIVITPISWNQGEVTFKKGSSAITATSFPVAATTADLTDLKGTVSSAPGDVNFKKGSRAITATSFPVAATTANLTELKGTVTEGICVSISGNGTSYDNGRYGYNVTNEAGKWYIKMGAKNTNAECKNLNLNEDEVNDLGIVAVVQTYCVFEPTMYTTQASCQSAGLIWEGGVCKAKMERLELTETQCESAGFTWDGASGCRYVYVGCNIINGGTNNGTNIENKPAVCKAAGCKWNGTTCTNP